MKKQFNKAIKPIEAFRTDLRFFERAIERINKSTCLMGINIPQCHTIMEIGMANSLSVNALAEKMNVDKSTVSRQVEKLVQNDLVTRITTAEDRRKVNISLSQKGLEIYEQMNRVLNEQFSTAFQAIPPTELRVFLKVFKQLAHKL